MKRKIGVLNLGLGNLQSVNNAVNYLGATTVCGMEKKLLENTDALIIPGVGAFPHAMQAIDTENLADFLSAYRLSGRPVLGICLGMQILMTDSTEFGLSRGLNFIQGSIYKLSDERFIKKPIRLPHVGWAAIKKHTLTSGLAHTLFEQLTEDNKFYFVHSYAARINSENTAAMTSYGDVEFASVVASENVVGVQFHPEKSGELGLEILTRFIKH